MNGAIETVYKGCRFRSRLEARWAVFFDALGIEWRYEEQGYEVDGHRYLPDFWLPACKAWAEVKGDPEGLRKDFPRMSAMLGPKSPLPGFQDGSTKLILLGQVPEPHAGSTLHPTLIREPGIRLVRTWGLFMPQKTGSATYVADPVPNWMHVLFRKYANRDPDQSPDSEGWLAEAWRLENTAMHIPIVQQAYRAARQARFEHGESPDA